MPEKLISEVIDLPDQVRKGDFVLKLAEGVTDPAKTLEQYVVTPQLSRCFADALGFLRSAVDAGNSKACYLHGSFGSGKSHFMAVLHLLLQHGTAVRSIPELAQVIDEHQWVEGKKFLLVPYHMIGSKNMESAILGGYVEAVLRLHPDAPLPGVYHADEIFQNAVQHREALGDEKFFAQLNQGQEGPADTRRGKLAAGWHAARFDAAIKAPPGNEERTRLVGDLVQRIFPAFRGVADSKEEAYVDLDQGLSVLSKHAKALGYDGLILFLDELILWLATHAADLHFVQTQGNKLAKLVESRVADRPVPIVSFVARQRDLRELIGDRATGAEQQNFGDVLSHWEGRFHTITLEDRNLPLIAQRRVLKPKNEACRAELAEAFEKTTQMNPEILEILLTRDADRALFRQVFPFSPAIIQALIAVSSALQRERTALKLMLQLLVNRRDSLRLGEMIPLGDLWDVVAHGDEAFSAVLRKHFDDAKKLYQTKIRPMLERQHEIDVDHARERAKADPDVAAKLRRYENDDRLIKSLLLCSLVDGADTLRDMTCSRLAALNHGAIRSRIPGREYQVVAQKLRGWAGEIGGFRFGGDDLDPIVSIQIAGVDTDAIIDAAKGYDNFGNQVSKVRKVLSQALGIEGSDGMLPTRRYVWRGSRRDCDVLFGNVREMTDDALRASESWKVVIDYPFDSQGHSPIEDVQRVEDFRKRNQLSNTIVWLPSFFSSRTMHELRKLVIIENLLLGNNLEQHASHLSLQDRETARTLLETQRGVLGQRLQQVLEAAYGLREEPSDGALESAYDMAEQHFQSLVPNKPLQRPDATTLGHALEHLLDQALSYQYPSHPRFGQEIKAGKDLKDVLEKCLEAAQVQDGRLFVEDSAVRQKLRNICNPLELGRMSETHFVLDRTWVERFDRQHAMSGESRLSVGALRRYMDQPEERGLPREIQNLLILVYADQTNRTFRDSGGPYTPTLQDLPNELEVREQPLPDEKDWSVALARVAELFGHALPRMRNASNTSQLASKVEQTVQQYGEAAGKLPERLRLVLEKLATPHERAEESDRLRTALAVTELLAACRDEEPTMLVRRLAEARIETSGPAMGKSLKSAQQVLDALAATRWDLFANICTMADHGNTQASMLLDDVRSWLMTDELSLAGDLGPRLREGETRAIELLKPPVVPPPPPPPPPVDPPPPEPGWKVVETQKSPNLDAKAGANLAATLAEKLKANPGYRLTIAWTIEEKEA